MAHPSPLDVPAVRTQFPALHDRRVVHADAPGGTQVPERVIAAMGDYLRRCNANSHGLFATSAETDALVERVRQQVAAFTGGESEGIVFGANMTTLTWHLSHALAGAVGRGDEIVCTRLDHDANVSPWLALAARVGASVRWVDIDGEGRLRTETLPVTERTRLVAFPAASNALGTVVDPVPLVHAARSVGALTFCDAVHAAPHVPLRRAEWGVDVLACSPYKFFGPHAGVLSADPQLLERLRPEKVRPAPDKGPDRWQTGTAAFEAIAGTGAALEYLDEVGIGRVVAHEAALTRQFLDGLPAGVTLHGPRSAQARTPTFSVTVAGRSPSALSAALADAGVYSWSGTYYAVEPMRALGLGEQGAVRVGFVHYHDSDDVARVLDALAAAT